MRIKDFFMESVPSQQIEKSSTKLNLIDKLYLGSIGLMIFSMFMPWITIPIIGSFNALNYWGGVATLFVLIGIIGLYLFKKKYSIISYLLLSTAFIIYLTYRIIQMRGFTIDLDFMEISIFPFLGGGVYLFLIGLIGGIIFSINKLKPNMSSKIKNFFMEKVPPQQIEKKK